jgi:hypothetical protein
MRLNKFSIVLSALSVASLPAFSQETATVLPKGIWRIRGVGIVVNPITHAYNNNGERQEILHSLNSQKVPVSVLAQTSTELNTLYKALNDFQPGLGDSLFQTQFDAHTEIDAQQYVFAAEYGVTSKLSLGLIVPTSRMAFRNTRFGSSNQENIAEVLRRTEGMPDVQAGVRSFAEKAPTTATFENALFTSKGYETPHDFSFQSLGDVEIGAKYKFYEQDRLVMGLKSGFRLPTTTHMKDYRNPLDRTAGDDQLDFATAYLTQFMPNPNLIFGASAQFTMQFADTRNMFVLKPGETGLPALDPDHNDKVRRNLGELLETEVSASYLFMDQQFRTYSLWSFSTKATDSYSGTKDLDYGSLSKDSRTLAHRAELGLAYSTIPLFRRKKFAVPLETKLAYNTSLYGVNTPDNDYFRLDMIVYF